MPVQRNYDDPKLWKDLAQSHYLQLDRFGRSMKQLQDEHSRLDDTSERAKIVWKLSLAEFRYFTIASTLGLECALKGLLVKHGGTFNHKKWRTHDCGRLWDLLPQEVREQVAEALPETEEIVGFYIRNCFSEGALWRYFPMDDVGPTEVARAMPYLWAMIAAIG